MRVVRVPAGLLTLAAGQAGLLSAQQCEAAGVSAHTRRRLVAGARWRAIGRGLWDTGTVPVDGPQARRARAFWTGQLAGGPDAVGVGLGALWWHGVWGVPAGMRPEVGLPGGRANRGPAGVVVRRFADPWATVVVRGRRVVDVETALVQALPEVSRRVAVGLVDSALNRRLLPADRLDAVRDGLRGRRGAAAVHEWWPLIDGRAESPLETWARLDCHDHRMPPDELQLELRSDDGAFLGRGDMAWRGRRRWVVAELDGRDVHDTPEAAHHDRRRQNALHLGTAVVVLRYTGADVRTSGLIARDMRQALALG